MRGDVDGKRQKILDAAKRLFSEKGYHGVSIPDIARASEASVGSIYYVFKDKEDILLSFFDDLNSVYHEVFKQGSAISDPLEQFKFTVRELYRSIDQAWELFIIMYKDYGTLDRDTLRRVLNMERETSSAIAQIIRDGQDQGRFYAGVDADVLAFDVVSLGHMWALKKSNRLRKWLSLEQYTESHLQFFMALLKQGEQ
ncbi:TetR/AcrR family transcriptional regulator [Alicyclobacillus sp. ALC3]|uniref:TetR/AcrR family transcriptional regulator n=1 Tax=Alicyclobacillus sp. ALC3 TaxID=2796143 RepID=UPI002378D9B4|nr:TetR/AcrR family transcriptional regulator [Alicyclobacillus sp. ALC3]WDL97714.1 TetR/AcrR family transcriptional regulator [Alicyclobacillus sp. ALC3]